MKKLSIFLFTLMMSLAAFAGEKISIATTTYTPTKDVVFIAKEKLEKKGYEVEVKLFNDYTTPNVALAQKEVDANFIQHEPYMKVFSKKLKSNFYKVTGVYNMHVAFYSKKYKSLNELTDGAKIAISNDPVNQEWALKELESLGLFKLADKASKGFFRPADIISNPKNLEITAVPIPTLSQAYEEYDLVFNWPAHMLKMGLTPVKNGLFVIDDKKDNELHAISLVSREDLKGSQKIKDLKEAITSKEVKEFLEKTYKDGGYPVF